MSDKNKFTLETGICATETQERELTKAIEALEGTQILIRRERASVTALNTNLRQLQIDMSHISSETGAWIEYCGHGGCFIADVHRICGAVIVRHDGRVDLNNLVRPGKPKYWLRDEPTPGFWRPDIGVFVVPAAQLLNAGEDRDGADIAEDN